MYAGLDRVHALHTPGFGLYYSEVCGTGLALQRGIHGRRARLSNLERSVSSFSSEKRPRSWQGSKGEIELRKDYLGPTDSSREEIITQRPHSRWWYGKDGELESTIPCPDCRGRGYVVCPLCDIATPELSCTECHGKGLKTCSCCLGKRAILVNPLYEEIPWEKNTARGPLLEIEDDEDIDNMDIQVVPKRNSKRIYSSPTAEVREKIRQALKSLDARTGSVTRRMRRIHNDPVLNAKRIAGIKKAKNTEAARKQASEKQRLFFQEPRNRLLRSLAVKGAAYYCSQCGAKGHRKNYCPALPSSSSSRTHRCSLCGQAGHKRTTCPQVRLSVEESDVGRKLKCGICRKAGHNARKCPSRPKTDGGG